MMRLKIVDSIVINLDLDSECNMDNSDTDNMDVQHDNNKNVVENCCEHFYSMPTN